MSAVQLHYLKIFVFSTDKEILRFPSHKIYCTLIYRKHNSLLFILRAISLLLAFCFGHWFVVNCELIWVCHWVNNLHLLHVLRMRKKVLCDCISHFKVLWSHLMIFWYSVCICVCDYKVHFCMHYKQCRVAYLLRTRFMAYF